MRAGGKGRGGTTPLALTAPGPQMDLTPGREGAGAGVTGGRIRGDLSPMHSLGRREEGPCFSLLGLEGV